MNEFIIIYCYRKIWEEIRNLINSPRTTISLREVMLLSQKLPAKPNPIPRNQNPQRRLPLTKLRRRRRRMMKIHGQLQSRPNAAAVSVFAQPRTVLVQHAADVSQSSVVLCPSESSPSWLQPSYSFGITSCSWTNISTGGILWFASCASFHCSLPPTSSSAGSLRTPESQDYFYGTPSSLLWSQLPFCADGNWSTSLYFTRDPISTKDKATLTHTLTPRSTRKTTFSSCFSRV